MKLILQANSLQKTSIRATQFTPEYVIVHYDTVPQNHPGTNGNFVQVWQDSEVEWNNPTGGWKATLSGNTTEGDLPLQILYQKKDYIIGYSVGNNVQNIVATAYIPGGDLSQQQVFSTGINVLPGQDSVLVDYITPETCTPQTFQHWVGLFNAQDNPYSATPLATTQISGDKRAGSVPILYSLAAGRSYTVAYFAGKAQTCVACTMTFDAG